MYILYYYEHGNRVQKLLQFFVCAPTTRAAYTVSP